MARNIEIKAHIESVDALLPQARALADGAPRTIRQHDTFFAVPHGRLKLRRIVGDAAELIHYHRPDVVAAKASDYVRVVVADAEALEAVLARACGIVAQVSKRRLLLTVRPTRIHLDTVDGLGDFVELEVVLRGGQTDADGTAVAEALMQALGLADAPRIAGAYADLLRSGADAA